MTDDDRRDVELARELERWREDWQGVADAPPADLIDRVRTLSRKQTRAAIGEVGASIFLVVVSAWLALRVPIAPVLALSGALLIYVGVWLTYFFTIRVGTWGAAGASVREWVERSRRLHRVDVQWARFSNACIIALAGLILVWAPWLVAARWERYRAEPWRGVVGFGTASLILVATWLWNRRKLARAIAAREELEEKVRAEP